MGGGVFVSVHARAAVSRNRRPVSSLTYSAADGAPGGWVSSGAARSRRGGVRRIDSHSVLDITGRAEAPQRTRRTRNIEICQ